MNKSPYSENRASQKGGILPLFVIFFVLIISFAAMAIDLGYLFVGKNELQNAADAAALAATRQISKIYQEPGVNISTYNVKVNNDWLHDDDEDRTTDDLTVIYAATEVAFLNKATHEGITIDAADVKIGVWSGGSFTEQDVRPTAVRVTARRDTSNVSGPIATFFSGIFGHDSFPVSANATAALTGKSTAVPGELELPIGISKKWLEGPPEDWCGDIVKFSPTSDPEACAGWTTFDYEPSNDVKVRKILLPEDDNQHLDSPGNSVTDFFEFINGDLSEGTFENLLAEYQSKGVDVNKVHDPDAFENDPENYDLPVPLEEGGSPVPLCAYPVEGSNDPKIDQCLAADVPDLQLRYPPCSGASGCNGPLRYAHEWETSIIVYDSDDCTPSGALPIYGYVRVEVFNVGFPSYKVVQARIKCDNIDDDDTRGGGPDFGTLGTVPNLVE